MEYWQNSGHWNLSSFVGNHKILWRCFDLGAAEERLEQAQKEEQNALELLQLEQCDQMDFLAPQMNQPLSSDWNMNIPKMMVHYSIAKRMEFLWLYELHSLRIERLHTIWIQDPLLEKLDLMRPLRKVETSRG